LDSVYNNKKQNTLKSLYQEFYKENQKLSEIHKNILSGNISRAYTELLLLNVFLKYDNKKTHIKNVKLSEWLYEANLYNEYKAFLRTLKSKYIIINTIKN